MNVKFIGKGKNLLKNRKVIQQEIKKEKLVGITVEQYTEYLKLKKENTYLKDGLDTQKRANGLLLAENEMHRKKDLEETKKIKKELMIEILETGLIAKIKEKMEETEKTLLFENLEKWEYEYLQGRKEACKELLEGK